ncbi:MAG: efflux RND transporter periplasmic adaptor subunit [Sphingomonadaceae bacterium]|nr:efflux RND transporter periplasmic adaptor subunit [Sphingomonadaceae bacterium]
MLDSHTPFHHDGPDRDTGLSATRLPPEPAVSATPASRRRKALIAVPAGVLALAIGYALIGQSPAPAAPAPLPTVTVAAPLERAVTEWDSYVGRFAASESVDIRPRVGGPITAIHFRDGQNVARGQLLFTIDPRPYTAALAEAQARASQARTAAALARAELARAERLIVDEAVSAQEIDTLRATVRAAEAQVAGADAAVRTRQLDVEFTAVRAPISGRISDRRADIGNLVAGGEAGSATLLTTIHKLDPLYFTFDGSEALYLKARRAGAGAGGEVEVRLQDEAAYKWRGTLDFTDNGIDPRSGTIRGRAVIANPDGFLTAGMFGNMRLASAGEREALLVPDTAIVSDQARKLVYVAAADGTVTARPVTLGPVINGLRIVAAGLTPADRVVIRGLQSVQPGQKAELRAGSIAPVAMVTAAATSLPVPAAQATFAR